MEAEFDLKGPVVVEFGRAIAADLVHFAEALPRKENDAARIFAFEAAINATEGEFSMAIAVKRHAGGLHEVEIVAIP